MTEAQRNQLPYRRIFGRRHFRPAARTRRRHRPSWCWMPCRPIRSRLARAARSASTRPARAWIRGEVLFVMFSAGAGQEALDRLGPDDRNPNSVLTLAVVDLVKRSDLDLIDVAKELQIEVPRPAQSVGSRAASSLLRSDSRTRVPCTGRWRRTAPARPGAATCCNTAPAVAAAVPLQSRRHHRRAAAAPPPVVAALPPATYRVPPNVSQVSTCAAAPARTSRWWSRSPRERQALSSAVPRCRWPARRLSSATAFHSAGRRVATTR